MQTSQEIREETAALRRTSERLAVLAELRTMTDREAVAYWNVLQMDERMLRVGDDGGHELHAELMDIILDERGIAHERGALTRSA